jgi:uncharacterized protein (UPF0216 family)
MTQEDILRMARAAGLYEDGKFFVLEHGELERFAAIVAAAEREACLAEFQFGRSNAEIKAAIRARGDK